MKERVGQGFLVHWTSCIGSGKLSQSTQRSYQGKKQGVMTIALEAAVDCRLWFWYAWLGMPGANNDLNILDCLPIFHDLSAGRTPKVHFAIK